MGMDTVLDSAQADVKNACAALRDLQALDFFKIPELDLLALAQSIEGLARLGFAAQVRVAGEIDARHTAASFGSASTVALLRETLTISAPDARARVNTAKMILPQVQPSGAVADPVLPDLAAAFADGLSVWSKPGLLWPPSRVPGTRTPGCWKKRRRLWSRPVR